MLDELKDSDWEQAFKYAGEDSGCDFWPEDPLPCEVNGTPIHVMFGTSEVSTAAFTREDVVRIIAMEEGENEGESWAIVGELRDGRFFSLTASCDYTGWG